MSNKQDSGSIVKDYDSGVSIDELAEKYDMTPQQVTELVVKPVKDEPTQPTKTA